MTMTTIPTPATITVGRRQAEVPIGGSNRKRRRRGRRPASAVTPAERYRAARYADAVKNGMPRGCPLTREEAAAQQFARMAGAR
jgi:hypothetical protein